MKSNIVTFLIVIILLAVGFTIATTFVQFTFAQKRVENSANALYKEGQHVCDISVPVGALTLNYYPQKKKIVTYAQKAYNAFIDEKDATRKMKAYQIVEKTVGIQLALLNAGEESQKDIRLDSYTETYIQKTNLTKQASSEYNAIVHSYNTLLHSFSGNICAKIFGMREEPYYGKYEKESEKEPLKKPQPNTITEKTSKTPVHEPAKKVTTKETWY